MSQNPNKSRQSSNPFFNHGLDYCCIFCLHHDLHDLMIASISHLFQVLSEAATWNSTNKASLLSSDYFGKLVTNTSTFQKLLNLPILLVGHGNFKILRVFTLHTRTRFGENSIIMKMKNGDEQIALIPIISGNLLSIGSQVVLRNRCEKFGRNVSNWKKITIQND